MAEPKVFARVSGFVSDWQCGTYTLGKEYPVLPEPPDGEESFFIEDDDGDAVLCWWAFDPDCHFERVVL